MAIPTIVKNFVSISSGVAIGQLLTFVAMPVISRLYSPADFGVLGAATSIAAVVASLSALQFPQALLLPKRHSVAANLFAISVFCSLSTALLSLVVLCGVAFFGRFQSELLPYLVWSVPLLALVAGLNQSLQAWCVRRKAFDRTALSPIVRSVAVVTSQVGLGMLRAGPAGLVSGAVLGDAAANVNLGRQIFKDDRRLFARSFSLKRMKCWAWHYRDVAQHATLQNLISTASIGMPIFLLSYFSAAAIVGYYSLAMRTLQVPMVLIIGALRQVLLQRLAEYIHDDKSMLPTIRRSIMYLSAVTLSLGVIFFICAPWLFSVVFGQNWKEAGEYSRWLVPWIASSFINTPCLIAAQVMRLQSFLLKYELVVLVGRVVSLVFGLYFFTPIFAVIFLSVVSATINILQTSIVYKRIDRRDTYINRKED